MSHQKQRYTDEDILEMLRDCKEEHGKCTPSLFRDMKSTCSVGTVLRRFGSWKDAKKEAGIEEDLTTEVGREKQYTREDMIQDLQEVQEEYGKCTTDLLLQEEDKVSPSVVAEEFGSWLKAKKEAGLEDERVHNARERKFTDEELLEALRECKEKHGKVSQRVFDKDEEFPSAGVVRKRFGSWSDAKKKAGVDESTTQEKKYTREQLLDMLRQCKEEYGKCTASVFAEDEKDLGFCSPETIQRRFGSWNEAKAEAGV